MKDLRRALKYFRPDAARVAGVFGMLLVSVALNVLKPWPVAVLIDSVLGQTPWPGQRQPIPNGCQAHDGRVVERGHFVLYFAQGAFSAAQNYYSIQASLRGLTRLREELFARLLRLSLRFPSGRDGRRFDLSRLVGHVFGANFVSARADDFCHGVALVGGHGLHHGALEPASDDGGAGAGAVAGHWHPLFWPRHARTHRPRATGRQPRDGAGAASHRRAAADTKLHARGIRGGRFRAEADEAQTRRLSQHGSELGYGFVVAVIFGFGTAVTTYLGARQVLAGA
jgi:hypothetical protein